MILSPIFKFFFYTHKNANVEINFESRTMITSPRKCACQQLYYTATERDNVYKPRVQNVFLGIIYVFSTA